ncbi:MAG TPA: STAS domain-containing protein [Acidobacteriaceae bacterium]|nr:STAS domain-containing protein [Acidobacteriaceae bacterium]
MRVVGVTQIPKIRSARDGRIFLRDLRKSIDENRPRLVLDCSNLRQLDRSSILLLLSCLEEVMKCNGDLKLADLPPGAAEMLHVTGADRLFDIYQTTAEAVNSFHQFPASMFTCLPETVLPPQQSGIVA